MTRVENVKARRQLTNYTCGPASLRTIFHFYGLDVPENELVSYGDITTNGTDPQTMRFLAREYGFSFFAKKNGTIPELIKWLERGVPILVMYQDWGPPNGKNGHYAVLTGVGKTHVEIADPANYVFGEKKRFSRTKRMRRDVFLRRWFEFEDGGIYYKKWFAIMKPKKKRKT